MATTSEVKSGLNDISAMIRGSRQRQGNAKDNLLVARNQLNSLITTFSDVITTINGYTPTGAFEQLAQAEKAALQTEFMTLLTALEVELTALGVSF